MGRHYYTLRLGPQRRGQSGEAHDGVPCLFRLQRGPCPAQHKYATLMPVWRHQTEFPQTLINTDFFNNKKWANLEQKNSTGDKNLNMEKVLINQRQCISFS
jgi:hypothetical protein